MHLGLLGQNCLLFLHLVYMRGLDQHVWHVCFLVEVPRRSLVQWESPSYPRDLCSKCLRIVRGWSFQVRIQGAFLHLAEQRLLLPGE
ncbi:hypothetical protein PBCV1_a343R [Paramecium bursaria Chlorella virus 1]|uniref:Uncharacterized protein n=1 Tax=Paramecium bursaria Chlorella virus 1 TaxID=10506 RepID=Q84657_PBCV1|nr:hypothetical protein PBCV1_a343R [Paramecium bursaria Chlorella virus 1]AAC96711.1 hypothetical protein [Paramecium bursaria Chlorella virus 1]